MNQFVIIFIISFIWFLHPAYSEINNLTIPVSVKYFCCISTPVKLQSVGFNQREDPNKMRMCFDPDNTFVPERKFNKLIVLTDKVIKHGDLRGEKYWYEHSPEWFREYLPKQYFLSDSTIELERIQGLPLSYLLTNSSITTKMLTRVLELISQLHGSEQSFPTDINIYKNYSNKLKKRYESYDYSRFSHASSTYQKLNDLLDTYEHNNMGKIGVIHGDPVFTNILISKDDELKFIDMRGALGDQPTIFGDVFYDFAKIYQTLWGYEFVLYQGEIPNDDQLKDLRSYFENWFVEKFDRQSLENLKYLTASLYFSMIPLHDNEKCDKYMTLCEKLLNDMQ